MTLTDLSGATESKQRDLDEYLEERDAWRRFQEEEDEKEGEERAPPEQEDHEEEEGVHISIDEDGEILEGEGKLDNSFTTGLMSALEEAMGSSFDHSPLSPGGKPLVVVLCGPSGVGKDAVLRKLQEERRELHFVVTATSRAMRPGEVHGEDYFFVTKDNFEQMIEEGELLEHAVVYGEYKGIPKEQVREALGRNTDVVLRIDVQGAATVRKIIPDAVFIFLVAESEASLVKRLVSRKTEKLDKLLLRVQTARQELSRLDEFDYVVVNAEGQLENTVAQIGSIIDAEKCRVKQRDVESQL